MKRAFALLTGLIALCSLAGCGGKAAPVVPAPPVILNLPDCPEPERPILPLIDGALPFDAPENIQVLLLRDDILRAYLKGLEATAQCYRRKTGEPKE